MVQRFVIEEFLKEIVEKLNITMTAECPDCDGDMDCEVWGITTDGGVIQFVQDWLQEHKGEL